MSKNSIVPFAETQQIATALAKSGYFPDAKSEAQAIVKVLAGQELGLGAFASMSGLHIIQGKPVMGANLLATLIKNDPRYNYQVIELTDDACEIVFFEQGKDIGRSRFTIQDARKAGTKNLDKFPRNMLFARAISNGAKWYTPGIFGGAPVYTPEDFNLDTNEDGEIIDVQAVEVEPAPASASTESAFAVAIPKYFENEFAARNAFKKSIINGLTGTPERILFWAQEYRAARDGGLDSDAAAVVADEAFNAEVERRKAAK